MPGCPFIRRYRFAMAVHPLVYRYTNGQDAFVLRGKRLVLSTSGPWLRSGFWLSGGFWMIPNGGQSEGRFSLIGYHYRGRGEAPDTLGLSSQTHTDICRAPAPVREISTPFSF